MNTFYPKAMFSKVYVSWMKKETITLYKAGYQQGPVDSLYFKRLG